MSRWRYRLVLRSVTLGALLAVVSFSGCVAHRPTLSRPTDALPLAAKTDASLRKVAGAGEPADVVNLSVPTLTLQSPAIPSSGRESPIDLPTALRLAEGQNPTIAAARARIAVARAELTSARALLLPSLNGGASYHAHDGTYQDSHGQLISLWSQSLYLGAGARAVSSLPPLIPGVVIATPLTDALFEPLASRQRVDRSTSEAEATANTILLDVATLHQRLHRAGAILKARRESEAEAAKVLEITASFAKVGQGRDADAERARTQLQLIRGSVRRTEEDVARASAALCRRLHLDPSCQLVPAEDPMTILVLIDPAAELEGLIVMAIARRPEIAARGAAVAEAQTRLHEEQSRPFLPTLWLGASGGSFGGGSNLMPPEFGRLGGRTDFDVMAYWTLENLGFGNLLRQKRRRAELGESGMQRARMIATVRDEVASSRADALVAREQLGLAVEELALAEDGFRLDLQRAREATGLPIELLNNLDLLLKAREALIDAVIGLNLAQLRLFVALGSPPPLEIPAGPIPSRPMREDLSRPALSTEP